MAKKYLIAVIALLAVVIVNAQTVGKFTFKNKEYFVYPYRISSADIPALGINIPDGEYVVFDTYSFKKKFSFHRDRRKQKYKLADTTIVSAIITVKNNLAQGAATFYDYSYKRNRKIKKIPYKITTGNLVNGLKTGQWRIESPKYKSYEIENYTNGVQNGYNTEYDSKNRLQKKTKYCDGSLCDTIFEYFNNQIIEEYDFLRNTNYNNNFNLYQIALNDFGHSHVKEAKTYYKRYDYNGNLRLSLKFNDGILLPFDSIGENYTSKDLKDELLRYVTVKTIGPDQLVVNNYYKNSFSTHNDKYYYKNGFNYLQDNYKVELRWKRRKFSRKYYVYKHDTTHRVTTLIDINTVNRKGIIPIPIYKSIYNNKDTSYSYYIPRYKFDYRSNSDFKFISVDTLTGGMYFTDITKDWRKTVKRTDRVRFIEMDKYYLETIKQNPCYLKNYIVIDNFYNDDKQERYYNSEMSGISANDFKGKIISSTYLHGDTLMNGQWFFAGSEKKGKNWQKGKRLSRNVSYREADGGGNFINGKKQGPWVEIDWTEPKRIPDDVSAYFFAHPKRVSSLIQQNYNNGLRDGLRVRYYVTDEDDEDFETDYEEEETETVHVKSANQKNKIKKNTIYKRSEMEFKNDTINGIYKTYYVNGKLAEEGQFVNGKLNGDYIKYDKQSKISSLTQFANGNLNGKYLRYENGKPECYAYFKNNILSDSLIYYFSSGKPMTCIYTNNERLNSKKLFFYNGQLKEEMTFNSSSTYNLTKETISSESFINILSSYKDSTNYKVNGSFTNYYENGQKLAEGTIANGKLSNAWKFYSITGALLHDVRFKDSIVVFKGSTDSVDIHGFYTGYYANGKKRCTGYLSSVDLNYDCFTKQDKVDPDFHVIDFFDMNGKQTVLNGNGYFVKYDHDGLKMSAGRTINFQKDSLWRYYTPDQKLNGIGFYANDEKDGVWYEGDLEGINFEDGACFDMNNPAEVKAYEQKRKDLNITRSIYKNGSRISYVNFRSNLSKTYKPRNRHHHVDF